MKNLKKLFEKWCGFDCKEFPGKASKHGFYFPIRYSNPNSSRFWIIFGVHNGENSCLFGDFAEKIPNKRINLKFSLKNLNVTSHAPDPHIYKKERDVFKRKVNKILENKKLGHSAYSDLYKTIPPKTYLSGGYLYVPFTSPAGEIEALQKISPNGEKRWMKGSEWLGSFFLIREPKKKDLIYICEGLNTGYAAALGSTNAGVALVGGIMNIENVAEFFLRQGHPVALCIEKSNKEDYINLKNKLDCFLVGSENYEDLDDFYRKTNLDLLKKTLTSFQEKYFIPLGLTKAGDVCVYIKATSNVSTYQKGAKDTLYMDSFNLSEVPKEREVLDKFYWKTRALCRQIGPVTNSYLIKEGIYPFNGKYYYFDLDNFYLVKEGSIVSINADQIISSDLALIKQKTNKSMDLTKLEPLSIAQMDKMFRYIRLFNMDDLSYKLLVGWVIQGCLCGGLPYRTPVWLLAPYATGKSQLTSRILQNFFLFPVRTEGRSTTPKWLARKCNGKAVPVFRDEFEPSIRHRGDTEIEMEYVRTSATERFPERGISAGLDDSTISFIYCFSIIYSSIEMPKEVSSAALNRIVNIDVQGTSDLNYEKKVQFFEKNMTLKVKSRLQLTCLLKLTEVVKLFHEYASNPKYAHIKSHKKTSYFTLSACYNTFFHDKITFDDLDGFLQVTKKETRSNILREALQLILKHNTYLSLEEDEILFSVLHRTPHNATLNRNGIHIHKNFLLIHHKLGVRYLIRLFKENKEEGLTFESLKQRLSTDGDYFIDSKTPGPKLGIQRVKHLRFDWDKIKKDFLGEADKLPKTSS